MTTESSEARPLSAPGEEGYQPDLAGFRYDLGFVLRAPLRHRWVAAGCVAFVLAVAAASSLVFKDLYQVTASILVQKDPAIMNLSSGAARGPDWDAPTRAARESVIRRSNLIAICQQTGLVEHYLANRSPLGRLRAAVLEAITGKTPTRDEIQEALADSLGTRIWVTTNSEGVVAIGFDWPDKEMAFRVVEAAVQNFVEERYASEVAMLGETISILEANAAKLNQEVEAGLTDLERQERARPQPARRAAPRVATPPRDEDLSRLQANLVSRRQELADLEQSRQRRLAELTAQLGQKEAIYAPMHPDVVALKQSIATLQQPSAAATALRAEIKELERGLADRGSAVAGTDVAPLTGSELLDPRYSLEPESVRIDYARGRMRFLRDQYTNVLQRLSTARLELAKTQAAHKFRYSVITPPARPNGPKKPYTLLRLLGGLVGGLGLAFFVSVAIDLRSGRIIEEWQIQRQLDLPVLARFER
jgi:uncharacterized protein involved in exopolysaccharide biosynthesis